MKHPLGDTVLTAQFDGGAHGFRQIRSSGPSRTGGQFVENRWIMDRPADSIAGTHGDLRHRSCTGAGGHGPITRHHKGSELVFSPDTTAEHDKICFVGRDAHDELGPLHARVQEGRVDIEAPGMIAEELDDALDEIEQRPLLPYIGREADGRVLVQPEHFARFDEGQTGTPIFPDPYAVAGTDRLAQNSRTPQPVILPTDFHYSLEGFYDSGS
jgi:hypothetical protein